MPRQTIPEARMPDDDAPGLATENAVLVAENDRLRGEIATLQAGAALSNDDAAARAALVAENERLRQLLAEAEGKAGGDRPRLVIVCATPGFRRGGVVHPQRAEYPLDAFTEAQLEAFAREPKLSLVPIGGEPIPNPLGVHGDGRPFLDVVGNAVGPGAMRVLADPDLRGRAHEAAVAQAVGAADAGIKTEALADTARLDFQGRR